MDPRLQSVLDNHRGGKEALIPVLQEAQETLGFLSEEAVFAISEGLGIPASEVFGVLSFYAQFRTTPVGRNLIHVCRGTACHVRGAPQVLQAMESFALEYLIRITPWVLRLSWGIFLIGSLITWPFLLVRII